MQDCENSLKFDRCGSYLCSTQLVITKRATDPTHSHLRSPGAASGAVLSRLAALAPHAAKETSNEIPIDNKLPTAAARQLNYLQAGRYFSRLGAPTTKPAGQQRIASPYSVISTDIDWAL